MERTVMPVFSQRFTPRSTRTTHTEGYKTGTF